MLVWTGRAHHSHVLASLGPDAPRCPRSAFLQASSACKGEAGKAPCWQVTLTVAKVRSQQENDAVGRKAAGASDTAGGQ